jgi:RHS repeat-associated protein
VHYIYDGLRVIQERDTNNTPLVSYTRGTDLLAAPKLNGGGSGTMEGAGGIGGLLARSDGYSGGNFTSHNYYHADGSGNITFLENSSESAAAIYRYDPFGNLISKSGSLADANVYRFSSKEIHVNSGMYYYGYRFYDPNLQRWINRDPIEEEGGGNLYGFVINGPTIWVDGDGMGLQPPSGPPPVPVPGDPNARWILKGTSGDRPKWVPDRNIPGSRSPPSASWDPDGHWDVDHGSGVRSRYDFRGKPIPEGNQHTNPHRRPKSGPGSRCAAVGAGAILIGTAATAEALDRMGKNGSMSRMAAAAKRGDDIDDMMFDAALDAALESGNASALHGVYGTWSLTKKAGGTNGCGR